MKYFDNNYKERLLKYKIVITTINEQKEIVKDILKLLERRKYANNS